MKMRLGLMGLLVLALSCHERERAGAAASTARLGAAANSSTAGSARAAAVPAIAAPGLAQSKSAICCEKNIPSRFATAAASPLLATVTSHAASSQPGASPDTSRAAHEGMV